MAGKEEQDKKIIVDEDWKSQAQKEKEVLKHEEQIEHDVDDERHDLLPDADFSGLVSMIATQAYYALGLLRTEEDKDRPADLAVAKYNIDTLGVIEEKTKGNLSEQEESLLEATLHQLRMVFVKVSSQEG
jgi:hypothetical protein